ncbi:two-component system, OmpR family, response regulator VicR [Sporobacter termitidis DSM 10068]|uniref:Stage 0 sporulation protein A homolog n=1 Tax=Sporobacter termitidis DSM 10068 TaxID=1123282 RepID=A0A1M5UNU4_9FIRM|nr:response regulator [Sporobacter termitidis]SHH64611.1 two-component system, OmpR family, response regulator VicR [Sporobacter termitidis DSM 10068]
MSKTILIVDDEKNIVDILSFNLKKEGYDVLAAYDGEKALKIYGDASPDLILLDVMLPVLSGFDVCTKIRATDYLTPIIMLTAREAETDKVLGLEIGADDYITKPFSIREVLARVKANIRRTSHAAPPEDIRADGIVVDLERYDVYVGGRSADLTQREFELFKFLWTQPGKVFSREELLREVWQYDYLGDLRAVDVAVRRLREKIEHDSAKPEHIMTKRGIGYYYEA